MQSFIEKSSELSKFAGVLQFYNLDFEQQKNKHGWEVHDSVLKMF